jgi:hypothetical protein
MMLVICFKKLNVIGSAHKYLFDLVEYIKYMLKEVI